MSAPRVHKPTRPAGTTRRAMRRLGEPAPDLPYAHGAPATAETLAEEVPIAFTYNGEAHAVMLATPCDLEDFARGFTLTQGIVDSAAEIEAIEIRPELAGIECAIRIPAARAAALAPDARRLPGLSACGLCGIRTLEDAVRWPGPVDSHVRVSGRALHLAFAGMRTRQPMFLATGATHAAGYADEAGEVLCVREDVGRHNALDKLIGALVAAGIDPRRGFAIVTSRASVEMVQKAARAGIGLLAAVSAPTALAVSLADSTGLTLLGFVRNGRHTVYTHPERVVDDGHATPHRAQEGRLEH
ncbi:MAG: formate dehydrogenase accessory sulfurtransferase FdhD [Gammaproteobacteria bacterium]